MSLLLKTDGSLWAAGRGYQGQLESSVNKQTSFVQVLEEGVKSISSLGENQPFHQVGRHALGMGLNSFGEFDGTTPKGIYLSDLELTCGQGRQVLA